VEALVAIDMALHRQLVELKQLQTYIARHSKSPGLAHARRVAELAEPGAESPMESRLRLLLILAGLPRPQVQVPLHDDLGRFLGRPDLYYPSHRLGIEYDGGTHRASLVEDNRRQNRLGNAGIRLLRFTSADYYNAPETIVSQVRTALSG
jgi:very-short-patch-repair endonuclease